MDDVEYRALKESLPFEWDKYPHIAVCREYKAQRIERYKDNILIAALPAQVPETEAMYDELKCMPSPSHLERHGLTLGERLSEVRSLDNFMLPLESQVLSAMDIDSMLRDSYVGRAPYGRASRSVQETYERRMNGAPHKQAHEDSLPERQAALIGMSGMGKTTLFERVLSRYPQVIYHPLHHIFQIVWLVLKMSAENKSMSALYAQFLMKVDRLIPDVNYLQQYGIKGTETRLQIGVDFAARKHCLGALAVDEVQHLANSPKGKEVVMSSLVNLSNERMFFLLVVGTKKARRVLGKDWREARRSIGPDWERLEKDDPEWRRLLTEMWPYQWTAKSAGLDDDMFDLFYDCTQGVIGLAVKLFAGAQVYALIQEFERVDLDCVKYVFRNHMKLLHPMIQALANDDYDALLRYDDIAPLDWNDFLNSIERRFAAKTSTAASVKPGDPSFVPRLAAAAHAVGLPAEAAEEAAKAVETDGKAKDLVDGLKKLTAQVAPTKVRRSSQRAGQVSPECFSRRPNDYRKAYACAQAERTTVLEQLKKLQMVGAPGALIPGL